MKRTESSNSPNKKNKNSYFCPGLWFFHKNGVAKHLSRQIMDRVNKEKNVLVP